LAASCRIGLFDDVDESNVIPVQPDSEMTELAEAGLEDYVLSLESA